MSTLVTVDEIIERRKKWTTSFSPISARAMEAWQQDFRDVLSEIHYLNVTAVTTSDSLGSMVGLKGQISWTGAPVEGVMADFRKIWCDDLAKGLIAYHAFQPMDNGFGFHFCALNGSDCYITGAFKVELGADRAVVVSSDSARSYR